jgi:hypothetical protein
MALFPNQVTTGADGLEEVTVTPSRSPFSVSDFVATVAGAGGLAKTNRFRVFIGDSDVGWWCEGAELPGRTLTTSDSRIYGAVYKTPTESQYQEVNLTFLCDINLSQKKYFDGWMDKINPIYQNGARNFDFAYRNDYVAPITIEHLSEDGTVKYSVELIDAYPTSVAHLQTNWQDDQFHKLQVTMAYEYWSTGQPSSPPNSNLQFNNSLPFAGFGSGSNAGPGIAGAGAKQQMNTLIGDGSKVLNKVSGLF